MGGGADQPLRVLLERLHQALPFGDARTRRGVQAKHRARVEAARQVLGPAVVAPYVSSGSLPVLSFEPAADLRQLNFVRVVLYIPPIEAISAG